MARCWIFQYKRDVAEKGPDGASWFCGYYDPAGKRRGKSCGPGARGKKAADQMKKKLEVKLGEGTYEDQSRIRWAAFRTLYEAAKAAKKPRSLKEIKSALDTFERVSKPCLVRTINQATIDAFVFARSKERGKNKKSKISPATVNKDLRHVRAALRWAAKRGFLARVPDFADVMLKEPVKLPRYVTPQDFATIYRDACPLARLPRAEGQNYGAVVWWQALIVFAYMTGWRIEQILSIRREDLDLEAGTVFSRHEDNKGGRDVRLPLHPIVIEHLRRIPGFAPYVFPWLHSSPHLWKEFCRIQTAAGIKLPCREDHEHTDACQTYAFHDLRRSFATMNADVLTPDALQALMQHRSRQTTQRYINVARQLNPAVEKIFVPDALRVAK